MTDKRREMEDLRAEISKLDGQLLGTLEKRGKLSKKIGEIRKSLASPIALPERARIDAIVGQANGDIPPEALR
ncbi:MAG: chorismate mutase, partial [Deltaproteobacteria bacterium]|nr:chorismate mutase [Deltaproteobacteria bacterium]